MVLDEFYTGISFDEHAFFGAHEKEKGCLL